MPNSKTPKLNDTQLVILLSASQREDGLAVAPENLPAARVKSLVAKLIAHGFLKEVRVKHDQPLWRTEDDGTRIGLRVTKTGAAAIGVAEDADGKERAKPSRRKKAAPRRGADEPRRGSKRAQVIALMQRKTGATLDEMVEATGWLPHTTRAALTGLRHQSYEIAKSKERGGKTVYRLAHAGA
jgi:hypothetical protein